MHGREPKRVATTRRQLLREVIEGDAQGMLELNDDPLVKRFTGDDPFESLEAARRFAREYDPYAVEGVGRWSSFERESGDFLGWCGLRRIDGEIDLGYRYLPRARGKGYPTEASRACLRIAFEEMGEPSVVGLAFPDNVASIRILEKLGMRRIGLVMSGDHEVVQFRLEREEWRRDPAALAYL